MSDTANPTPEAENRIVPAPARPTNSVADFSSRPFVFVLGVIVVVAIGIAVWYFAIRTPPTDLEMLQGDWQMVIADRETQNVIQVRGDQWQSVANGVKARPYRISLKETTTPKQIDLDPVDTAKITGPVPKLHGIYSPDGERFRVRLGPGTEPRPTTFDDPDATVLTLTKVKLEPAAQKRK